MPSQSPSSIVPLAYPSAQRSLRSSPMRQGSLGRMTLHTLQFRPHVMACKHCHNMSDMSQYVAMPNKSNHHNLIRTSFSGTICYPEATLPGLPDSRDTFLQQEWNLAQSVRYVKICSTLQPGILSMIGPFWNLLNMLEHESCQCLHEITHNQQFYWNFAPASQKPMINVFSSSKSEHLQRGAFRKFQKPSQWETLNLQLGPLRSTLVEKLLHLINTLTFFYNFYTQPCASTMSHFSNMFDKSKANGKAAAKTETSSGTFARNDALGRLWRAPSVQLPKGN